MVGSATRRFRVAVRAPAAALASYQRVADAMTDELKSALGCGEVRMPAAPRTAANVDGRVDARRSDKVPERVGRERAVAKDEGEVQPWRSVTTYALSAHVTVMVPFMVVG